MWLISEGLMGRSELLGTVFVVQMKQVLDNKCLIKYNMAKGNNEDVCKKYATKTMTGDLRASMKKE